MKIVVLDGLTLNPGDNPWDPVAKLGELAVYDRTPVDQVVARIGDADAVLTNKTPLTADVLSQLPRVKYIGVLATGFNVVDVPAARKGGIVVTNVPEYGTNSVGQYTIALLMALCHHIPEHDAVVRNGEWRRRKDFSFTLRPMVELAGLTMGIVGFGRIGRRVGELAHALGMGVLAYSPQPSDEPTYEPFGWAEVRTIFAKADVVSLHCPLTEQNKQMVDRALLSWMKPTALLINTARGGLVNEADLAVALNAGQIAGAALDVVSAEPITDDNPLLTARNCLLTPHMAWSTVAARRRLMQQAADNLAAFGRGEPINVVG